MNTKGPSTFKEVFWSTPAQMFAPVIAFWRALVASHSAQ